MSGKRVIVDSSKSPDRLESLLRSGVVDVTPLHLVRSAKGTVHSQMRRKGSLLRASVYFNRRTFRIRSLLRDVDSRIVRYERLVEEPAAVLKSLMNSMDLDFEESQLDWAERERHHLSGNLVRRSTDNRIAKDIRWQTGLQPWQKVAIDVLTLPGNIAISSRN